MRTLNCRYPGLKEWCEKHGVNAPTLAERLGILIGTAQKVIYYGDRVTLDTAQLIADGLGLTMDKLFHTTSTVQMSNVKDRERAQATIHLTDSDIAEIRTMYKQAKDPQKRIGILADMYVCMKDEIKQVLGLTIADQRRKRQYIKWTPKLDKQLLELQSEGKTNCEIAEMIGTTEGSVSKRALRLRAKIEKAACNTGSCKR